MSKLFRAHSLMPEGCFFGGPPDSNTGGELDPGIPLAVVSNSIAMLILLKALLKPDDEAVVAAIRVFGIDANLACISTCSFRNSTSRASNFNSFFFRS